MNNYIHYKVRYEITYPFLNFNGATVQVLEWISNCISHLAVLVIIYPCWDLSSPTLVKWAPGCQSISHSTKLRRSLNRVPNFCTSTLHHAVYQYTLMSKVAKYFHGLTTSILGSQITRFAKSWTKLHQASTDYFNNKRYKISESVSHWRGSFMQSLTSWAARLQNMWSEFLINLIFVTTMPWNQWWI